MKDEEIKIYIENLELLKGLLQDTLSPAIEAYDVLVDCKFKGNSAYQLSLGFLNLANQSFVLARMLCNEHRVYVEEIDQLFGSFNAYKSELEEYISEKDNNSSWLNSRKEEFVKDCDKSIEFITKYILERKNV